MNYFSKVNSLGFIMLATLVGCNSVSNEQVAASNETEITEEEIAIVVYDSTMHIGSVKVGFTSLPLPTYIGYDWQDFDPDAESKIIRKDPNVSRDGLNLIFQLKNGKKKTLTDIPYDEEQTNYDPILESVEYVFQGEIANANAYQVDANCYEYWYAIVMNKVNGDTLEVIGDAACSSHGTWLIAYNFDMEAGYTPNGLELFQKKGVHYQKIGTKLLETWGVTGAKWMNDSVVRLRKVSFDKNWDQQFTYVDLTILGD